MLNTIGPHWDGNEVWLITAGGAIFAAFPYWYASLFSGFYLPLFLILLGLILRGVAIEFRSLDENPRWRSLWDWAFCLGSFIPSFLWGVAFANFMRGVPIDANQNYAGGFWNLLNPYALVGGLVPVFAFLAYGALFLSLKTSGDAQLQARKTAFAFWIPNALVLVFFIGLTYFQTDILSKLGVNPGIVPIGAVLAVLTCGYFIRQKMDGWAFAMAAVGIVFSVATIFMQLFPRVLVSSLDPGWSLTIYNTASSPYTLTTMSIIAAIFVPIMLAYQAWSYWIFRKRITEKVEGLHY
jgi:cytochrome d ubiquinol oxidase subunit II